VIVLKFDFTNTDDMGFTQLPPAKYPVVTEQWWFYKKAESGNLVVSVGTKVTSGKFAGETSRYFQTLRLGEGGHIDAKSMGFLLLMLRNLGIIRDGDRKGKEGKLIAEFIYGETNDDGHIRIKAVSVNGEERPVEGLKATAVVTVRDDDKTKTGISRLDPPDNSNTEVTPAEAHAVGGKSGVTGGEWNIPF